MIRHRRSSLLLLSLLVAALLGACTEDNPSFIEPLRCASDQALYLQTFQGTHPERVDVILLVEQTPRAAAAQRALRDATPRLLAALGELDYHVGVVGSAQSGRLTSGSCAQGAFVRSDAADPAAHLDCLLEALAAESSAEVRPAALEALATAVTTSGGAPGFVRPDARLLVIALGVQDDCSGLPPEASLEECEWRRGELVPVDTLFQTLRNARPDTNAIAVATLVGPLDDRNFPRGTTPEPACSGPLGDAFHGLRYRELAALAAPWSVTESVCAPELSAALEAAVSQLATASESRYCLGRDAVGGVSAVQVVEGDLRRELEPGADGGFGFLGATADCPDGAVVLGLEARQGFTAATRVEVFFCGP